MLPYTGNCVSHSFIGSTVFDYLTQPCTSMFWSLQALNLSFVTVKTSKILVSKKQSTD